MSGVVRWERGRRGVVVQVQEGGHGKEYSASVVERVKNKTKGER